jgi:hypothetical protein
MTAITAGAHPGIDILAQIRRGLILMATAFTNIGAGVIANRVIQAGTAPKYIGWGTSTTAPAVTDTALGAEAAPTTSGGRTIGTEARVTTTVTNDTYQVSGTITATAALDITEAGTFDAASAGNMVLHTGFTGYNVAINDALTLTLGVKYVPGIT